MTVTDLNIQYNLEVKIYVALEGVYILQQALIYNTFKI